MAQHTVSIYDSTSSQLAVNAPDQKVDWARETMGDLTALRVGTVDQPVLAPAGDDTRIDWGYAYLAAHTAQAQVQPSARTSADRVRLSSMAIFPTTTMPNAAGRQRRSAGAGVCVRSGQRSAPSRSRAM